MRLTILALSVAFSPSLLAAVVFDNGGPDVAVPDAVASDVSYGIPPSLTSIVADDFTLGPDGTTIADVRWWGGYGLSNTPATDHFQIRIHDGDASGPDASTYQTIFVGAATRQATGTTFAVSPFPASGFDLFEYRAATTPFAVSAGHTYWLSIVNDSTDDPDDDWYWFTSNSFNGDAYRQTADGTPFHLHPGRFGDEVEFAFQLRDVPEPFPTPLPASLPLLIGSVGLLSFSLRPRRERPRQ